MIKRPGVDEFMKRVGELYEVVVFTASVSKVSLIRSSAMARLVLMICSMETLCWTSSTSTKLSTTDSSERAATTTKATMSRISLKSDEI